MRMLIVHFAALLPAFVFGLMLNSIGRLMGAEDMMQPLEPAQSKIMLLSVLPWAALLGLWAGLIFHLHGFGVELVAATLIYGVELALAALVVGVLLRGYVLPFTRRWLHRVTV